ncbi:hypothetical protein lerEdw1_018775 [Lerista edwardsae]|nr:hypothetical protein lerEdw1_018775 [Lerista edwardsae]
MSVAVEEAVLPSISTFAGLVPLENGQPEMRTPPTGSPAAWRPPHPNPNYPLPETPESYDSDGSNYQSPNKFAASYLPSPGHSYVAELFTQDMQQQPATSATTGPGPCELQRREYTELRAPGLAAPHPDLGRGLSMEHLRVKQEPMDSQACMLGGGGPEFLGPAALDHKPVLMPPMLLHPQQQHLHPQQAHLPQQAPAGFPAEHMGPAPQCLVASGDMHAQMAAPQHYPRAPHAFPPNFPGQMPPQFHGHFSVFREPLKAHGQGLHGLLVTPPNSPVLDYYAPMGPPRGLQAQEGPEVLGPKAHRHPQLRIRRLWQDLHQELAPQGAHANPHR